MESKKIFSKLALDEVFNVKTSPPKKIIAARIENNVRVTLKRTFLPLLIEVFELKGQMQRIIAQSRDPRLKVIEKPINKTPEQVIDRLEAIVENIDETMRWCEGLRNQLEKALKTAQSAKELP